MKPWTDVTSKALHLLEDDIDTDQIVPARFLRTAAADGFAAALFHDRRVTADGQLIPGFPLNPPHYQGESILITGRNFGCGSSREHAPWALRDFGIKAIIAPSFGEIFYSNCLKNSLLPIALSNADYQHVCRITAPLTISVNRQVIAAADWNCSFRIDPFARYCLMHGLQEIDYILQNETHIERFEAATRKKFVSTAEFL